MASPPLLDFDALTAPITSDAPAGPPLPYDVRLKLEELRKEINPDDYDSDDARRPKEARKPDWKGIVQLATDTLTSTSKDLLAAARLAEALTFDRGMAGLRDALDLLARLAAECWDRLHPPIEVGDTPEVREGPFKWLNESDFGARFPVSLRSTPLITVAGQGFAFVDWQNQTRRGAFESAVASLSEDVCRDLVEDLKIARDRLKALNDTLQDKMGEFAPDLTSSENTENLGAAVNDCLKVANQILQRKSGSPSGGAAEALGGAQASPGASGDGGASIAHSMAGRTDAYRMLNNAADLLQRLEPHSPIPYLVKRAVKLGELKFPELMRALIRENTVLDELNRLMGIEAPPS